MILGDPRINEFLRNSKDPIEFLRDSLILGDPPTEYGHPLETLCKPGDAPTFDRRFGGVAILCGGGLRNIDCSSPYPTCNNNLYVVARGVRRGTINVF